MSEREYEALRSALASARMEGISCGGKPTSCPDQLAQALRNAMAK